MVVKDFAGVIKVQGFNHKSKTQVAFSKIALAGVGCR